MFTDLLVEKFRGFRRLHVPVLPQIALLTGRNGSGKTALLEAVFALYGRSTPTWIIDLQAHHGFARWPVTGGPSYLGLFYGMTDEGTATINGRAADGHQYAIELKRAPTAVVAPLPASSAAVGGLGRTSDLVCVALKDGHRENESSLTWTLEPSGKPSFRITGAREARPAGLLLHPAAGPVGDEEAQRFGTAKAENRARTIVAGAQNFDPTIDDIEYLPTETGGQLYAKRKDQYIPIGLLGGGLSNVFRYLVSFDYARGGFVGIDEVENGIHHSVLGTVFRHLVQGAIQANTQLIMSTHSQEAVRALSSVVQEYVPNQKDQIAVIHLRRDDHDTVELTSITGHELVSSVDLGYELR